MTVFDIETDGLLNKLTKIHVLSYVRDGGEVVSTHDYEEMRYFFLNEPTLVGHFITGFDIPAVEKVLKIKVKSRLIDTLILSWYLSPDRASHGLAGYGDQYGVTKPKVSDWDNLTADQYKHRCQEDVKINVRLWLEQSAKLTRLYKDDLEKGRFVDYMTNKMLTAREQADRGWRLDVPLANRLLSEWEGLKAIKANELSRLMPYKKTWVIKHKPTPEGMVKKDGSPTVRALKWTELMAIRKMPNSTECIRVCDKSSEPNPNSTDQIKDWLYSMGWSPCTFTYLTGASGDPRRIPQVRRNGQLTQSVLDLIPNNPTVAYLEGYTVLSHRIGILRSFVSCHTDGILRATVQGLTNTFRFRHSKPLVNLPSVDKPYGKDIRSCLITRVGKTLCGADMVSLEDTTKRHYMQPHDPGYVAEMSKEGFDPHLDLAKFAGAVTQEDIDRHNSGEASLKNMRKSYKVVNYSATYGIGAEKLSRTTGLSTSACSKLLDAFWQRNWAVTKVAKTVRIRELLGKTWIQNPVSKFWHILRSDKDRFSTLNQSTGVYCFDTWVNHARRKGVSILGQFHDEIIVELDQGDQTEVTEVLLNCMKETNKDVQLNIPLSIDYNFGKNYAEVH
tara:strand:+ start:7974 stop:9818 length:1845 start_codon:yes stop_codon:yes gene_type:complete